MNNDAAALAAGLPPEDDDVLERLSAGAGFITDFWLEQYLDAYIAPGGSKIKFITGRRGSGKTHCMRLFLAGAKKRGYKTALISAGSTWVSDFRGIYTAVLKAVDLPDCLQQCANRIIEAMGFQPGDIPRGSTFADFLSSAGGMDPMTRRELREQIVRYFLKNPRIDNNFALACAIMTGGILGYPPLETSGRATLLGWLSGAKDTRLSEVRKLGLSPVRISKHNARHMLRSLVEVVKTAGYPGVVAGVDDLDEIINTSSLAELRYTKLRREDTYESIRELIDDIDTLSYTMFVFAFDRGLLENESAGLKSYQALWMRVQNEIDGGKFNRFADIVDMDRLARQVYTAETLSEISGRLAAFMRAAGAEAGPLDPETARKLKEDDSFLSVPLPLKINRLTLIGDPCEAKGAENV
jgi:archaellum biogenesis ATPase FlaH